MYLSADLLTRLCNYLAATESALVAFRDHVVQLRVDRYNQLSTDDRAFLDMFEGRYAELTSELLSESQFRDVLRFAVAGIAATVKQDACVLFSQTSQASAVVYRPNNSTSSSPAFDPFPSSGNREVGRELDLRLATAS